MGLSPYDLALWEISRRALKSENLKFKIDEALDINIQTLSDTISDKAPSIIIEILAIPSQTKNQILIYNNEKIIGLISLNEPMELEYIWLAKNPKEFWPDFINKISNLVEAGYPGCVGCGGPGSEEVWDEKINRIMFHKFNLS